MRFVDFLCFFTPAFFGITCFSATNSILFSSLITVLSLLYFLIFFRKKILAYRFNIKRFNECYSFINDFLICLSVKKSLPASFETILLSASDSLEEELNTINDLSEMEKLIYLERYFPFASYKLFVEIVSFWNEQGGDILELSNDLLAQIKDEEEYIIYSQNSAKRKTIEFASLWLVSFLVLFILRFSLTDFYVSMSKQLIYQMGIFCVFLLALFSIELLKKNICKTQIKGWNYDHK